MCYIGVFVAIMAVCAQIRIPFPGGVPFTMQTWAVALSGVVLGPRRGAVAALVYILLGAVGAPVFNGFTGGIGIVAGVTGGFIVTFPALAFAAGIGAVRENTFFLVAGVLAGTFVNFTVGMFWFAVVSQGTLFSAFTVAIMPFILPEIFKIVTVVIVGKSIQFALIKARVTI
jgi:biotin transport system substrate-specific component